MIDRISVDATITVTSGAIVITNRVYGNPAALAAFSAINTTPATVTASLGPSNTYCDFVSTVTPNTAVGIVAEGKKYVADHTNAGAGTLL